MKKRNPTSDLKAKIAFRHPSITKISSPDSSKQIVISRKSQINFKLNCNLCKLNKQHSKCDSLFNLTNKLLKRTIKGCSEYYTYVADKIIEQKATKEYLDYHETVLEKESNLFSRFYRQNEFTNKIQILYKFCKFVFLFPKLYNVQSYKIARKFIYLKRKRREQTMRKILEEISDSDINLLSLEYVVMCENTCTPMSLSQFFKNKDMLINQLKSPKMTYNKNFLDNLIDESTNDQKNIPNPFEIENSGICEGENSKNISDFLSESYMLNCDPERWQNIMESTQKTRQITNNGKEINRLFKKKEVSEIKNIYNNFKKQETFSKKSSFFKKKKRMSLYDGFDKKKLENLTKAEEPKVRFDTRQIAIKTAVKQSTKNNALSERIIKNPTEIINNLKFDSKMLSQRTILNPIKPIGVDFSKKTAQNNIAYTLEVCEEYNGVMSKKQNTKKKENHERGTSSHSTTSLNHIFSERTYRTKNFLKPNFLNKPSMNEYHQTLATHSNFPNEGEDLVAINRKPGNIDTDSKKIQNGGNKEPHQLKYNQADMAVDKKMLQSDYCFTNSKNSTNLNPVKKLSFNNTFKNMPKLNPVKQNSATKHVPKPAPSFYPLSTRVISLISKQSFNNKEANLPKIEKTETSDHLYNFRKASLEHKLKSFRKTDYRPFIGSKGNIQK